MKIFFIRHTAYDIRYTKSGFTLLEILIVIAIFAILAGIGASPLLSFKKTGELNSTIETAVSFLLDARSRTLSSKGETQYGVHFSPAGPTLFQGAAFTAGATGNEAAPLPSSIEIGGISLASGGADVVFKRLTGETDGYGTVVFRLKSDTARTRTVHIEKTGIVSTE